MQRSHWDSGLGTGVLAALTLLWGGTFILCSPHKPLKPGNLLVAFAAASSPPRAEDFVICVSKTQEEVPASNVCFPVILVFEVTSFSKLSNPFL